MADHATGSDDGDRQSIPKACIFDIGGVVVGSPLLGINRYEKTHGLPYNYLNVAITQIGQQGAFQRLERSEIDMYTFYKQFGQELSQVEEMNRWYSGFCQMRKLPVPASLPSSLSVDGRELFGEMMRETTNIDPIVANAIRRLRASGKFVLAALTNNFAPPTHVSGGSGGGGVHGAEASDGKVPSLEEELKHLGLDKDAQLVRSLFDHYIESAVVGKRKPEMDFYHHALRVLDAKPHEVVFLDDIGINLKAAQSIGIRTIRVASKSSLPAIRALEKVVQMTLVTEEEAKREEERLRGKEERAKL